MFTGIIEDRGKIISATGSRLVVRTILSAAKGDSISVNGVCLTVTETAGRGKNSTVSFDYTPETAGHTTLSDLCTGDEVNLERALKAESRVGGHFVTGHIEGTGTITTVKRNGNSHVFDLKIEPNLMKYIIVKGSVAIEGISLTVADCLKGGFSVSVIPFTYENTNLKRKKAGDKVNIETDMLAKYIEKLVNFDNKNPISIEFLKENGF